jgi:HNH endonuclease
MPTYADQDTRFWDKVLVGDGCWEWQATRRGGYGRYRIDGRLEDAHRVAYRLWFGPIPDGLDVLHSCDNPSCVRPAHLRVGTHAENMAEAVARRRFPGRLKTECPQGHPYDDVNTYVNRKGHRSCRICKARSDRERRAKEKRRASC